MSRVPAQFKKQDGTLTLSEEGARAVVWKANSGDAAPVTIPLLDITSMPSSRAPLTPELISRDRSPANPGHVRQSLDPHHRPGKGKLHLHLHVGLRPR